MTRARNRAFPKLASRYRDMLLDRIVLKKRHHQFRTTFAPGAPVELTVIGETENEESAFDTVV